MTTDNHTITVERCDGCSVLDGADGVVLRGYFVENVTELLLVAVDHGAGDYSLLCDDCSDIIEEEGAVAKFDRGV